MTGCLVEPVKRIITVTLMENSAVYGVVSGRVFGAHLDDADAQNATYPLVIVSMRAGTRTYNPAYQEPVFELWCYSRESQGEATDLYDKCRTALHAELLTRKDDAGVTEVSIVPVETLGLTEGWNENARAWFATGNWMGRSIG
jgi:hypothetical protein